MGMIDPDGYDVLTFDCYGTLIDWETGILDALRPVMANRALSLDDDRLLEIYARVEPRVEDGPYMLYRKVLVEVMRGICDELGFPPTDEEARVLIDSFEKWPPFADTEGSLIRLATRYRLCVVSNIDDDMFVMSQQRMHVRFDRVVTAQQVGCYKPDHRMFETAIERIGVPRERILHVAQSLFHDHIPAREMGFHTAWINRRHDRPGSGATPPSVADPTVELPDLASLADLLIG